MLLYFMSFRGRIWKLISSGVAIRGIAYVLKYRNYLSCFEGRWKFVFFYECIYDECQMWIQFCQTVKSSFSAHAGIVDGPVGLLTSRFYNTSSHSFSEIMRNIN